MSLSSTAQIEWLQEEVAESITAHVAAAQLFPDVVASARALAAAFRAGRRAYFFGNGGSAADAQHWAGELSGRFQMERPPLPALVLPSNTAALTAIANDYGYEHVFSRPLAGTVTAGDVVVGISTSGTSANVVRALDVARAAGAVTLGFTGRTGGDMIDRCDHVICVASDKTARIQEVHALCGHLMCGLVERILFGDDTTPLAPDIASSARNEASAGDGHEGQYPSAPHVHEARAGTTESAPTDV